MSLTLTSPDDWHLHLRDGAAMRDVVTFSARQFRRALIMPNLQPPVCDVEAALAYRQRILDALPADSTFTPCMSLYLTADTRPETIRQAAATPEILACKLYPSGATTNSAQGIRDIDALMPVLETMAECDLPLCMHGESVEQHIDIFDREARFIDKTLAPLLQRLPTLRVVMEHITTADAVEFVRSADARIAATITPQHIRYNRNALLVGGVRPHFYCLPILKREQHRQSVLDAALSGNPRFFLGTDSAPHGRGQKENACGCAGIFSAHAALEFYADTFDAHGALDKLEGFASHFGADFYGLARNSGTVTLERREWPVPAHYRFGDDSLVPLLAGETLGWKLRDEEVA